MQKDYKTIQNQPGLLTLQSQCDVFPLLLGFLHGIFNFQKIHRFSLTVFVFEKRSVIPDTQKSIKIF
jgi:hypothetical protein